MGAVRQLEPLPACTFAARGRASRSSCPPTRDWGRTSPWIVKLDDDSIWLRETGPPAEGYWRGHTWLSFATTAFGST
jgi:hypothetical protein